MRPVGVLVLDQRNVEAELPEQAQEDVCAAGECYETEVFRREQTREHDHAADAEQIHADPHCDHPCGASGGLGGEVGHPVRGAINVYCFSMSTVVPRRSKCSCLVLAAL